MQGRIVFATGNAGKIKEIRMIMEDTGLEVVSMKDAGIKADIEENGKTYEENALIKARAVAAFTKDIVMADDSGLEIDALNKEPGIYSARYLGEDTPYSIKNANLIQRLEGVPEEKRTARFVCAIAAVLPDGRELTTRATIEGRIGYEEKGTNGFGYDPIFYVPEFGKTTAELTEEEKNQVSHRGKALQLMKEELKKYKKNENYFKVLEMHHPDMVIHCGDAEGSEYALSSAAECPVYIVLGNNDFFSDLPREITLDIGSYKVWVTHGHNYYVSMGNETIKKEAIDRGVDIVLYGHTHRPVIDIDDDIIAVNPGSLSYPRQEGRQPSYALMEIDREGKVHFTIAYLRQ